MPGNKLGGSLPSSWNQLKRLIKVDLSANLGLGGPLPAAWSNMTTLAIINLAGCKFSGNLPDGWSKLPCFTDTKWVPVDVNEQPVIAHRCNCLCSANSRKRCMLCSVIVQGASAFAYISQALFLREVCHCTADIGARAASCRVFDCCCCSCPFIAGMCRPTEDAQKLNVSAAAI
jgi:hypothetical protein